jgi:tetratricopeptide (TPR) repeat protein
MKFPVMLIYFVFTGLFLFAQTGPGPVHDAGWNYRTGRDLEAQGRLDAAAPYYDEAVRICTDEITQNRASGDSYAVLTWTLRRQQKYADVITWGERGLRLYNDDYRIVETMGEAYFYLNNYNAALQAMQRYVNALPQGERASVAYFFIGEIYRLTRRYRLADIAYTTAIHLEPGLALWWYRLGSVREAVEDFAPATEAYEGALRLNPNYREAAEGRSRSQRGGSSLLHTQ